MDVTRLLPKKERYTLITKLPAEEVFRRMSENIEPKQYFRWTKWYQTSPAYEGKIWKDGFRINKITGRNRDKMPIINGHFFAEGNATKIAVQSRISYTVSLFLIILFCATIIPAVLFIVHVIINNRHSSASRSPLAIVVTPLVFIAFYWYFISYYRMEVNYSRWYLCQLLEAEEI